ncbi:hypothetical protein K502DRAFT_364881 [Neoconidiobolus thromboides FSU 785]|nr:hypothetical protein K502DRAFT_364881 [Neoconidiobolus thromboides FSU 785]
MEFKGYIPNINEAILLASASVNNVVPLTQGRNRDSIYHGKTIIFSLKNSKIARWTDNKKWSASTFRDGFFIYYEKKEKKELNYILNDVLCKKCIKVYYKDDVIGIVNYFYLNSTQKLLIPSQFNFSSNVYSLVGHFSYIKDYRTKSKYYGKLIKLNGTMINLDPPVISSVSSYNSCSSPLPSINELLTFTKIAHNPRRISFDQIQLSKFNS